MKLKALQDAFTNKLTCFFSAQVDKLKLDLDTTLITHNMADIRDSLLDGQQVPVLLSAPQLLCWLCSHAFPPPLPGSVQQEWGQEGGGTAPPIVANSAGSLPSSCVPVGEAGCWFAWQADPACKHRAG